ncbi:MAG: hypothetical protein IT427_12160 [Pirellulales bacterium]|nr:hypothetical protein [Pirellulales bacterium]
MPGFARNSDLSLPPKVAATGFEPPADSSGKTPILGQGGAECGALGERKAPIGPELAAVVDAWPMLPTDTKLTILVLIGAAK